MPARNGAPRELRVLVWNVWVGQHPAKVLAALLILVALFWPHAIVLQEAKRYRGSLPGYRRHAADDLKRKDATNCIVLVRKGLKQSGFPVPVDGPGWVHKKPKPPRTFYAVAVAWLWIVDVHRCTRGMGGDNAGAWQSEHEALLELGEDLLGELAMLGDWNAHPDRRHPTAPLALAREIHAQVVADDEDVVDYALLRGVRGSLRRLRFKLGSDHRPWLITLTHKEKP